MRQSLKGTPALKQVLDNNKDQKFHVAVFQTLSNTRALLYRKPKGEARAHEAMVAMDAITEDAMRARVEAKGEPISCKKGCSACCYQKVQIGDSEARAIVEFMIAERVPFSHSIMQAQAAHDKLTDAQYWQLPKEERRCPFLSEDGACNVYAVRPLACRKYLVLSEPELCATESGKAKVKVAINANAEVLASAMLDLERDLQGILAKKVLEKISGR